MRTTLNISDDVLIAVKRIASEDGASIGRVVTALLRAALLLRPTPPENEAPAIYGFRPFPSRGAIVTNELINELREDDEN
jgi:hypothetical protein